MSVQTLESQLRSMERRKIEVEGELLEVRDALLRVTCVKYDLENALEVEKNHTARLLFIISQFVCGDISKDTLILRVNEFKKGS